MNLKFEIQVAENHVKMAEALSNSGETSRAQTAYRRAAKQYEKLGEIAPDRKQEFDSLAAKYSSMADNVVCSGGAARIQNSNKSVAKQETAKAPVASPASEADKQAAFQEGINELNDLIGIKGVKNQVNKLMKVVKVDAERKAQGLPVGKTNQHLVFTGNPGTGKTTVARIIAKLYFGLGLLPENKLIELDRSGVVAGYVGQTAIKTKEVIDNAIGGVLFIDEVYTLAKGGNDFGQEAIDTILKGMEDNRDNLVVVVAGYSGPMQRFLDANEGMRSRFKNVIDFEDYSDDELVQIFKILCKKSQSVYKDEDLAYIKKAIKVERDHVARDKFGNARTLRNLYEDLLDVQKMRLAELDHPTKEQLMTLTKEDFENVLKAVKSKYKD